MLTILMLSSCKTVTKLVEVPVEVPVEVTKKEYIHDIKIDSVYVIDSIDRWHKGDTLYIAKWHTKYKYINKVDTILKTDTIPKVVSIPKVVPVEKKVEVNHIYWWQKALMWLGSIMTLLFAGIITYKIKFK